MAREPIVIIGAGINGLVCAALLARKGRKVIVLERSDRAGGCMRTDQITLPGFDHDVMAATFVLFVTSPFYPEFAEDLARWSGAHLVFAPSLADSLDALAAALPAHTALTEGNRTSAL